MSCFPLCIDLRGQRVLLVGSGPQIEEKAEKLRPFGPVLVQADRLTEESLSPPPAMVIAGGLDEPEAARVSRLCKGRSIPVNVVDKPKLCSFYFPALICRGDVTVGISTGGKSPAAAAYLRRSLEAALPDRTGEIVDWLHSLRGTLPGPTLRSAARTAFSLNRPLTDQELQALET